MRARLAARRNRIVRLFIASGILVFIVLWWTESQAGIILPFDRHAYPVVIAFLSIGLMTIVAAPTLAPIAELACFLGVSFYLLLLVAVLGLSGASANLYTFANTLLWIPVIYVAAFVFFPRRRAIIATWGTFFLTLLIMGAALVLPGRGTIGTETKLLFANAVGGHLLVLLCLSLVTALRQEFDRVASHARLMEDAANTDQLTGIANRRGLEQWLGSATDVDEDRAALILFDVDHFKAVNDRFGHVVGDEVLFSTAQLIKSQLHGDDFVGRWGGEEFLVILPNGALPHAMRLAESIRLIVSLSSHPLAGAVTLSAGIALWHRASPMTEAFRAADAALLVAKASGRNCIAVQ